MSSPQMMRMFGLALSWAWTIAVVLKRATPTVIAAATQVAIGFFIVTSLYVIALSTHLATGPVRRHASLYDAPEADAPATGRPLSADGQSLPVFMLRTWAITCSR